MSPSPRTNPARVPGVGRLPEIKLPKDEVDGVVDAVMESLAAKMGITPDKLPPDVASAVRSASEGAMDNRLKSLIQRDADRAVKDKLMAKVSPVDVLRERLKAAQVGIGAIKGNSEVDTILKDTATLLWKKFQALTGAGFSDNQAFDLLLAEVQGRSARSR